MSRELFTTYFTHTLNYFLFSRYTSTAAICYVRSRLPPTLCCIVFSLFLALRLPSYTRIVTLLDSLWLAFLHISFRTCSSFFLYSLYIPLNIVFVVMRFSTPLPQLSKFLNISVSYRSPLVHRNISVPMRLFSGYVYSILAKTVLSFLIMALCI